MLCGNNRKKGIILVVLIGKGESCNVVMKRKKEIMLCGNDRKKRIM